MLRVMCSLSFAVLDRGADSAPAPQHLLTKLRISDFLDLIIPGLVNFLVLQHGPEGRLDEQALFCSLLALVHVEHLFERLGDKNPYLGI